MNRILFAAATLASLPVIAQPAPVDDSNDSDIDLGALGLDPAVLFDDKLQIYGFADFNYQVLSSTSSLIPTTRSFYVGNLNLYFKKNITQRWRALTEVRLLFAPNGSTNADGSTMSTGVTDAANMERLVSWGGISIERAYLEYEVAPSLSVRAGHWLTPYGIWNIDHGSPTIIGTVRPYIVGEQFFPEHQTGIEVFGARGIGDYKVEYHATISNGRNPSEATRDADLRPSVGGRLAIEAPWAGTARVGMSGYGGRATESATVGFDEAAIGMDASWDHGGLHLQGELLAQRRWYLEGKRPMRGTGLATDGNAWGTYALAGYRFASLWNVMPYLMVERYRPFDPALFEGVRAATGGLNFRPAASVVLKAQYIVARFDAGEGAFAASNIQIVQLQTAWVF